MGSEALTYHEKKALGFGTVKERVGKVSGPSCCHALAAARPIRRSLDPLKLDLRQ
jgi:hypothetical protein